MVTSIVTFGAEYAPTRLTFYSRCYSMSNDDVHIGPISVNIGGGLSSTPQSLADAHYQSAVQCTVTLPIRKTH